MQEASKYMSKSITCTMCTVEIPTFWQFSNGSVQQVSHFRIKWLSVQSMSCARDTPPDVIDQMTNQLHENMFSSLHLNSSMFKKILIQGVAEHMQFLS